ncbi:MAG: helix-turn-helix domain-containing protein [Candidatus Pacearchaeota archaeon]
MTALRAELVNKVKNYFGLNIYETKVWLALLQKGVASAGEIADISGVPRSRTYDVLEGLEKQGFAVQKIGKPVKYLAVRPTAVIEKLKKKTTETMNEKIDLLSNIKSTKEYEELELLHSSKTEMIKKQDISATLRGRTNIHGQIADLINLAKKEVLICSPTKDIRKKLRFLEPIVKEVGKQGVKFTIALSGDDAEIKQISEKLKTDIKKVNLNASFFIADRAEILFMLNDSELSEGKVEDIAVWFSSPFFVQSFASLFDIALKKGK